MRNLKNTVWKTPFGALRVFRKGVASKISSRGFRCSDGFQFLQLPLSKQPASSTPIGMVLGPNVPATQSVLAGVKEAHNGLFFENLQLNLTEPSESKFRR